MKFSLQFIKSSIRLLFKWKYEGFLIKNNFILVVSYCCDRLLLFIITLLSFSIKLLANDLNYFVVVLPNSFPIN